MKCSKVKGVYVWAVAIAQVLSYAKIRIIRKVGNDSFALPYYCQRTKHKCEMKRFEIINGKCVIPEGIDYIEDYEFYCSDDLREVVFPESLSSIGREAFKGCWNLREIHLPAGLVEIEEAAFSGCCSLEVIEVAKGNPIFGSEGNCCLTDDGKTLVFGCKASVIPDTVETVGRAAFQWCETLTGISIPASVRTSRTGPSMVALHSGTSSFPVRGTSSRSGRIPSRAAPASARSPSRRASGKSVPGPLRNVRIYGPSTSRAGSPVSRTAPFSDARHCPDFPSRTPSPRSGATLSAGAATLRA